MQADNVGELFGFPVPVLGEERAIRGGGMNGEGGASVGREAVPDLGADVEREDGVEVCGGPDGEATHFFDVGGEVLGQEGEELVGEGAGFGPGEGGFAVEKGGIEGDGAVDEGSGEGAVLAADLEGVNTRVVSGQPLV